jgi:hypothetical protein
VYFVPCSLHWTTLRFWSWFLVQHFSFRGFCISAVRPGDVCWGRLFSIWWRSVLGFVLDRLPGSLRNRRCIMSWVWWRGLCFIFACSGWCLWGGRFNFIRSVSWTIVVSLVAGVSCWIWCGVNGSDLVIGWGLGIGVILFFLASRVRIVPIFCFFGIKIKFCCL